MVRHLLLLDPAGPPAARMSPAMAFALTVAAATAGVFAAAIGGYVLGRRTRRVTALPRRQPGAAAAAGGGWFGEQKLPPCPDGPNELYAFWTSYDVLSDSDED